MVVSLVISAMMSEFVARQWRLTAKQWEELCDRIQLSHKQVFVGQVDAILKAFCEATELSNHVVSLHDGKLEVKIGDEDVLVKVDIDDTDFIAALEKAHIEWMAEKKRMH